MNAFQNVQPPQKRHRVSGPPKTWDKAHSVPVAPPSISHPTSYPRPLQPKAWASLSFPQLLFPLQTCPELSWSSDPLLITCPFSLLFLSHSPHPLLSWPGLVWSLLDASSHILPRICNKTLLSHT